MGESGREMEVGEGGIMGEWGEWGVGCRLLISRPELRLVGRGEDSVLLGWGEVGEADAGLWLGGDHDGRGLIDD